MSSNSEYEQKRFWEHPLGKGWVTESIEGINFTYNKYFFNKFFNQPLLDGKVSSSSHIIDYSKINNE